MTETKTDLLVRMWRTSEGVTGPTAEFRIDEFVDVPATTAGFMGCAMIASTSKPPVTPTGVGASIRARVHPRHAIEISQADYNLIERVARDGSAVINGDTWYSVRARLRPAANMRGMEVVPGTFEAGRKLVVMLTDEELEAGAGEARGTFVSLGDVEANMVPQDIFAPA